MQDFLASKASLVDCAEWLAGVDWDDPDIAPRMNKKLLACSELLVTEVAEEMRDEEELRQEAARFLAEMTTPAIP